MDFSRFSLSGLAVVRAAGRGAGRRSSRRSSAPSRPWRWWPASRRGCPSHGAGRSMRRGAGWRLRLPDQRRQREAADRAGAGAARQPAAGGGAARRARRAPGRRLPGRCSRTWRRWCSTAPRFRRHCPRGDGTAFEIVGEPRGGAAFLSIRPASEEARALARRRRRSSPAPPPSCGFLRDVLDRAPVLAWSHGARRPGRLGQRRLPRPLRRARRRTARPPHRRRLRPRARGGAADRARRRQPPPGRRCPAGERRRAALVRDLPDARRRAARRSASPWPPTTWSRPRRRSGASSRP